MRQLLTLIALLFLGGAALFGQIRIACVGNSITEGYALKDPLAEAYPAVLQRILGDEFEVMNFGLSGYTMMNAGDAPYMNAGPGKRRFQEALACNPDIVTVKLGTNDSKARNWDNYKAEFEPSMNALIDSFMCLPKKPVIYICLPIPAAGEGYSIRPDVVDNEVCPLIMKVATERNLPVIDLNSAFRPYLETLEDNIHPNRLGAALIAEEIARQILVDRAEGKIPVTK